jgi:predicted permease
MGAIIGDVRSTLRGLRKSPGFTIAIVLIMGLGIAINTAMFAVADAVVLSPLPYPEPERLTVVWSAGENYERAPLSGPEFVELARAVSQHQALGGVWATEGTLVGDGAAEPLRLAVVTGQFLQLLGTSPIRGRLLQPGDEGEDVEPRIVISGELWQTKFGGADVLGRRVRVAGGWGFGGGVYTIVGVMPVGFEMLLPLDSSVPRKVSAWIPIDRDLSEDGPRASAFLRVVGRLAPGASVAAAQEEIARVGREVIRANTAAPPSRRFVVFPLHEDLVRNARPALLVFQVAALLVLLIACANVSNLLLVRAQQRRNEIAIRSALGAPRPRLARLLLLEAGLLSAGGGLLGAVLALAGLRLFHVLQPTSLPRAEAATANWAGFAISVVAAVGLGLVFGLLPLVGPWRRTLVVQATGGSGSLAVPHARTRSALVLVEIALGAVLLVSAGLMIRSFINLRAIDPGYRAENVLTFQLTLPGDRYGKPQALAGFTRDLERELTRLPGVIAAGAANQLPLDDTPNWATPYYTRGTEASQPVRPADARLVTAGYFPTIQATIVAGRSFTERDDETQPLVLVVDERLARNAWPGQNPIGQELGARVWTGNGFSMVWGRVVGVVRHLRHHRPSEEVREEVFVPFAQAPRPQMGVVVRAAAGIDQDGLLRSIRAQVAALDPGLAPTRVRSLHEGIAGSRASARLSMAVAALFAIIALVLACVGLYSVIAYAVSQRMPELAVRVSMGAEKSHLVRLVVGHGATLTIVGLAVGLVAAIGASRLLRAYLVGLLPYDPLTFAVGGGVLAVAALLACYVPARAAAKADPVSLLRAQ